MERVIWAKRVIVIISFLLIGFIIYQYLSYPWLWYDEAGQFWISKGLNHYSSPYETPQGLLQVIDNNRYYNLDPGGFSILLHFWLLISNKVFFVRLFPLFFFICFTYFVYRYVYELTNRKFYAFLCSVFFCIWDVSANLIVEVRAYSMEMCGIALTLWLLNRNRKLSTIRVLLLSIVLSFFCTSRYDFIIFSFGISLYVSFLIFTQKNRIRNLIIYYSPLLITVYCIYQLMTIYQNSTAEMLYYIPYLNKIITSCGFLYNELFQLFILNGLLVLFNIINKHKISDLQILSILIPFIVCILSFIGKYPWDTKRTISIVILIILNFMVELGKIRYLHTYVCLLFSFFMMNFIGVNPMYVKGKEGYRYYAFLDIIQKKSNYKIFVDRYFNPSVRYLYEYGNLNKEKIGYADKFHFQTGLKHNLKFGQKHKVKVQEPIVDGNQFDCEYYLSNDNVEHKNLIKIGNYIYQKKNVDIN